MLQLQHQGLLSGLCLRLPLGLWGIGDSNWTQVEAIPGFLKITAASAACFLAGYPPIWLVLAIYWSVYALFSRRLLVALAAISASLLLVLAVIGFFPALEASSLMLKENRYGLGIRDPSFYLSYLIPNFYDFGINVSSMTNPGREYLYLGAPAVFGIVALLRYRSWRPIVPLLASGAVCVIFLTNPFHALSALSEKLQFFGQVCGAWYFLAGITATAAGLAAFGIDQFLLRPKKLPNVWTIAAIVSTAAWAIYELHAWHASAPPPRLAVRARRRGQRSSSSSSASSQLALARRWPPPCYSAPQSITNHSAPANDSTHFRERYRTNTPETVSSRWTRKGVSGAGRLIRNIEFSRTLPRPHSARAETPRPVLAPRRRSFCHPALPRLCQRTWSPLRIEIANSAYR